MKYSDDQIKALDLLEDFVFNSKEEVFLLKGKPGVGKTTIIKEFINKLKNKRYKSFIVCAPTHKAARVLSDGIEEEVLTIHKLLSLAPIVNILDFDLNDLKFKYDTQSSDKKLIIIDESSMINDELYEAILKYGRYSKIIFIADFKQLKPVKSKTLSKVSLISNNFTLTTNHRQDNKVIIKLVEESRNNIITDFTKYESENIDIYKSAKAMADDAIDNFKMQSNLEFEKFCKILTYTNERVNSFNKYIHNALTDEEYHFNEIMTGYSNFRDIIKNSEDYLVKEFTKGSKFIPEIQLSLDGYHVMLKSMLSGTMNAIFILERNTPQNTKDVLGEAMENIRLKALRSNARNRWKGWYDLNDSFATTFDVMHNGRIIKKKTLDYGYAITLHRSQGSTYDLVYYDNNSIQFCYDLQEKRQLQHVALSRVREKLNILI